MSLKQFQVLKLAAVIILGALVGYSVTINSYLIPLISFTLAIVILFWARSLVKEVVADERDYEVGGHAARWAMQIFSWAATIAMFVLLYEKAANPIFETAAYVLGYSVCGLLLLYALLFRYYNRIRLMKNKGYYLVFGLILVIIFIIAGLRLFTGEDTWICQNGQVVAHGHPSSPAPVDICHK